MKHAFLSIAFVLGSSFAFVACGDDDDDFDTCVDECQDALDSCNVDCDDGDCEVECNNDFDDCNDACDDF